MNNELLALLQKRKEHTDKEATMAAVAGGVISMLSNDDGEVADYSAGLVKNRLDRGAAIEDQSSKYQMANAMASDKAEKDKNSTTGKRRFSFQTYQDAKGNIKIAKGDSFTGDLTPTDMLRGYKLSSPKDPRTGEIIQVSGSKLGAKPTTLALAEGQKAAPNTVKEEKDLRSVKKQFMDDPLVKSSRKAIASSNRAIELLASDNPVAHEGIKTIFPRMFGEVGNLAAQEQERFSGSPAFFRKFLKLKSRWMDGVLSDEDKSDLLEVAQVMAAYDTKQLKSLVSGYTKSENVLSGVERGTVRKVINPMSKVPGARGAIADQVRKNPIKGAMMERYYKGKMRKFKKTSRGWEMVK